MIGSQGLWSPDGPGGEASNPESLEVLEAPLADTPTRTRSVGCGLERHQTRWGHTHFKLSAGRCNPAQCRRTRTLDRLTADRRPWHRERRPACESPNSGACWSCLGQAPLEVDPVAHPQVGEPGSAREGRSSMTRCTGDRQLLDLAGAFEDNVAHRLRFSWCDGVAQSGRYLAFLKSTIPPRVTDSTHFSVEN